MAKHPIALEATYHAAIADLDAREAASRGTLTANYIHAALKPGLSALALAGLTSDYQRALGDLADLSSENRGRLTVEFVNQAITSHRT